MINEMSRATVYMELEEKIKLVVNGKMVEVFKYQKQDPQFSEYENEIKIKDEEMLYEDEIDEINDYFEDKK
jgi:saccharopine dehydrogenase-like NADP-dependent oxidoreductase